MPKSRSKPGALLVEDLRAHFAQLVLSSAMQHAAVIGPSWPTSTLREDVAGVCCEALIRALSQHMFLDFNVPSIPSEVSNEEVD